MGGEGGLFDKLPHRSRDLGEVKEHLCAYVKEEHTG